MRRSKEGAAQAPKRQQQESGRGQRAIPSVCQLMEATALVLSL